MKRFRQILIKKRPFRVFRLYCCECNKVLIEKDNLTESPLKDEVLILHRLRNHAGTTGHNSFDGNIEPWVGLEKVDTTIKANNDV